ncbi:DUF6454 family protein [Thermocrispum agreste]|jgi:hypothetical protein|uniref:DUF6454 family protein n=1 Tax=Thermocrispum agreste TaxID=37925 RepID=UPI0004129DFE|nr:DUF6454 family protein [Thermocrispum agreste]
MRARTFLALLAVPVAMIGVVGSSSAAPGGGKGKAHRDEPLAEAIRQVDRSTAWRLVDRIPLAFETHHPQGLAAVGDKLFLSSVEIIERPTPYPEPDEDGYDRSPGKGVGHVFVLTRDGKLIRDIEVGEGPEGTIYHPGGIDYDGRHVWVPVAEYRPNSSAIIYRIDPRTYRVTEEFGYRDHVGGVVVDRVTGDVHGVTWGSRRMVHWNRHGHLRKVEQNVSHFIDYQDCAYVGSRKQLCTGITELATADGGRFELGGAALLDLRDNAILHEVPLPGFSTAGHTITRNPVLFEVDGDTLRMIAAPDDGEEGAGTELLVYETDLS